MIGLGLVLQLGAVTVGDTVWLSMSVPVPNGYLLRPQVWDLGDLGVSLAPPDVDYRAGVAVVRYPVAFWFPGEHRVTIPGPIIVSTAGKSDTLGGAVQTVTVVSVLPDTAAKATTASRPAAELVVQSTPSWLPAVVLTGLVIAAAAAVFARRRRRPVTLPPPIPPPAGPPIEEVLDRWLAAGEARTALDGWAHLIAQEAEGRSEAARAEASTLREELIAASFQPNPDASRLDELLAAARRWRGRGP